VLKAEGKAIFSPTVYKAVEQYLQHRYDYDVQMGSKGLERGLATIDRQRIDYLSDERIREAMLKEGYVKTFEERTKRKRYIRTHTHRMIAKAVKNIEAVEKGTFGKGHFEEKEVL
jgi:hypothetical protein